MIDGSPNLSEQSFLQNIKNVIGVDCPFFGKMMYLFFSDGFDKTLITPAVFFERLVPFVDDKNRA